MAATPPHSGLPVLAIHGDLKPNAVSTGDLFAGMTAHRSLTVGTQADGASVLDHRHNQSEASLHGPTCEPAERVWWVRRLPGAMGCEAN
jgi:hypothetical protein